MLLITRFTKNKTTLYTIGKEDRSKTPEYFGYVRLSMLLKKTFLKTFLITYIRNKLNVTLPCYHG